MGTVDDTVGNDRITADLADVDGEIDVLDLRGLGAYRVDDLEEGPDGDGFDGTAVLLNADGTETGRLEFAGVDAVLGDTRPVPILLERLSDAPQTEAMVQDTLDDFEDAKTLSKVNTAASAVRPAGADFVTYTRGGQDAGLVTFVDEKSMTFAELENVVPCFTPGTTIATPRGERLVQDLRVGDRIITRDNGIQEIRWVGHKTINGRKLVGSPHLRPVLVKAGALGHGLPERDMKVSPNHRLLVSNERTQLYFQESEVLASAKHLVGGPGIHSIDVMTVTYIHFMFDEHEVVLSDGAWTESFQPGEYALRGIGTSQRSEITDLFPELTTTKGIQSYAAARKTLRKYEAKLLVD